MAGEDLLASVLLGGLGGAAAGPSPWTIAAQGLASTLPLLIDPNASRSSNLIAGLGGGLVSGLMGGYGQYSQQLEQQRQQQVGMQLVDPTVPAEQKAALMQDPQNAPMASRLKLYEALQKQQALAADQAAKNQLFQAVAKERASEGFDVPGFDQYMAKITGSPLQTAVAATAAPTIEQPTPATVAAQVPTVQPTTATAGLPITPKDQKNLRIKEAEIAFQKAADQPNKDRDLVLKITSDVDTVGKELAQLQSQYKAAAEGLAKQDTGAALNQLTKMSVKIADPDSVVSKAEQDAAASFQSLWSKYEGKVKQAIAGKPTMTPAEVDQLLAAMKPFVQAKGEQYNMLFDQALKKGEAFNVWNPADPKVENFFSVPKFRGVTVDLEGELRQIATAIKAGGLTPEQLAAAKVRAAEIARGLGKTIPGM